METAERKELLFWRRIRKKERYKDVEKIYLDLQMKGELIENINKIWRNAIMGYHIYITQQLEAKENEVEKKLPEERKKLLKEKEKLESEFNEHRLKNRFGTGISIESNIKFNGNN